MKQTNHFPGNVLRWGISLVVLTSLITVYSCKKDDTNKPAPSLTVSSSSASNIPGATVNTTVTVNAPEGGNNLSILVNGGVDSSLPDVTLDGTSSQDVDIAYTIPANATIGTTSLITFQASDKKGQLSTVGTFLVTVTSTPPKPVKEVTGNIMHDRHFVADTVYRLVGFVRVGKDEVPGAGQAPVISARVTLTIDPGTLILGAVASTGPGGTLIVQRGSKIMAVGTVSAPIVFTSEKAAVERKAGDWGGFVLCGLSANNTKGTASTSTDGIGELEGNYGAYHGGIEGGGSTNGALDLADNSGTVQYVRVEWAGFPINPNQEINGVTFGSVGSGTTFDHVQVSYANDDSYEWFGGTIEAKNLIAYKGIDDDFDTDNGFSGHVQFGLGIRDQGIADQSGSNGFECDNDAAGSSNTPYTSAKFSNMTIIGGKATAGTTAHIQFQNGAQIRRNAQQDIFNSIITAYPNGIYIDNQLGTPGTISNAANDLLEFKGNILAGVKDWGGNGFGSASTASERHAFTGNDAGDGTYPFLILAPGNTPPVTVPSDIAHPSPPGGRVVAGGVGSFSNGRFGTYTEVNINAEIPVLWWLDDNELALKWNDTGLNANIFEPLNGTPTLLPAASSTLTSGATWDWATTPPAFFQQVTYRGAFGPTDWTLGWTDWNPQATAH